MAFARDSPGQQNGLSGDGTEVAVTLAVCLFIASLTVGLRLWVSRVRKQPFVASDYMVLGSMFFFYSYAIATYMILAIGHVGYPMKETAPWRLTFTFKCFYYIQIAYALGLGLVKCSILLVLWRIFGVCSKAFRILIHILLALCVSWSIMTILIGFLNCRPLNYNWNLQDPGDHCGDQNAAFAAVGLVDIATDVMIVILPVPLVLKLKLPTSKKIGVCGIFALGIFTISITIVRTIVIMTADFATINETGKMIFIWTMVEWAVAIMVASGPMLRPLFDSFVFARPFQFTSENSTRSSENRGSHVLGALQTPASRGYNRTPAGKTAAAETSSTQSSRSIMRGFGTGWAEATNTGQCPERNSMPEPGEVRVQTEWTVERC